MPDKLTTYVQLAEDTTRAIMHSHETWTAFLSTAARMYKYAYNDQLMIHAQRPAATACAPYEVWNQKMSRYVRRGSKGIALLDSSGDTVALHYVFDVADTGTTRRSPPMNLWQMERHHTLPIMDALQSTYDTAPAGGLERQVEQIALRLSDLYWQEHRVDILGIVDGSFMEGYDELAVGSCFRQAAGISITYTLLERCGLEPQKRFTQEDFIPVFEWNTREATTVLGTAVSEISGQMLRQIERTVKDFDRAHSAERMDGYERTDLQTQRGLSDSESEPKFAGASASGEIRQDAQDLSEGASPDPVEQSAADREVGQPSEGDRPHGEQPLGADDDRAGDANGRNREPEGKKSDGLDAADERAESAGGRSAADGAGVQLNFLDASEESLFLSEAEQISMAESVVSTPFAFSFSQEEIDHVLRLGGNADGGRLPIVAFFMKEKSVDEQAAFLQKTFRGGNGVRTDKRSIAAWYAEDGIHLASDDSARYARHAQVLSWQDAAGRIQELLSNGDYATNVELAEAPGYERKRLAESIWYLKQDFAAETHEQGFLSSVTRATGGFPQDTEYLASRLADPQYVAALADEMRQLVAAYRADRTLLRFHNHRPAELRDRLNDLSLPRREYATQMTDIPWVNEFITQDEVDVALGRGSSVEGGKNRISTLFTQPHTPKEQADFLKNEYGIGGRSHALSGSNGSWIGYDGKGMKLQKKGCPDIQLSWTAVAKRIGELIRKDRYLTEQEKMQRQESKAAHQEADITEAMNEPEDVSLPVPEIAEAPAGTESTEVRVAKPYLVVAYHHFENGFDDKLDYPTLEEAEKAAQGYVNGTMEADGFRYDGSAVYDLSERKYLRVFGDYPDSKAQEQTKRLTVSEETTISEEISRIAPTAEPAANYRITDEHLGEGGAKAKYRMNMDAIRLLMALEQEKRQATPDEQETLSRYVGWGGLPEAFDANNAAWTDEFQALRSVLSQDEYEAARASTLNAHYTSPAVIRAIYEAVANMGFTTGNILEPSMGVGNFFGMLPESMQDSRLYGVELDSITGRIAKQLYPKAHITVAGFETTDRKDFFDLAIGNVPFGNYQVNDRAYNKLGFSIHNYFFAKALDQVRPGGVVAFVTSRYTMDQQSPDVRRYLAQRAELLGAIRLPNNAFKANAGTEVVSDIIFLQKRDRPIEIEPDWVHLSKNADGFAINSYFVDHPEMVLGEQSAAHTQYGHQDFTVLPIEGANLADQLHEAVQHIGGTYQEAELPELGEGEAIDTSIPADLNVKNYSYAVVDGEVYYRENSRMARPDLNATAKERVKGLVALRDCVHALIDEQLNEYGDDAIQARQAELNTLYDAYTAKYGLINDRANRLAFSDDSSYYLLCSLEVLDDEQKLKRKADIFTKRTIRQQRTIDHVDTASEALAVSISEHARVDLPYMAQLTGKDEEALASDLSGVIFRLPGTAAQYVTADEYLSGNVRQKLREAKLAAESNPAFSPNVTALEAAQPKDLEASEIDVRLGATWISKDYVQDFMYELLDTPVYMRRAISVNFSPYTAEWNVTGKSAVASSNVAAYVTYGTQRASAYRILEDTLNLRDVRIYDTVQDADGKERRVLNQKETTLAQQKQQAIKDAFGEWVWKDAVRRQTLVSQYNEQFNAIRPREYDGQHITFVGMNPEISLREHQRNAVAHILYGGNTLLAHQVGAGKTFEMVAAAMESKRLGLCQKSMFVVPNHLTEQWASEFLRLYPSAQILVTTKKDFEKHNRKKFCARIATGDYDAIIIGHSQFERIPISAERQERILRDQIDSVLDGIGELKRNHGEQFSIKQLERSRKQLETHLQKLQAEEKKDDVVTFEQLGVDRLYVDEAHSHKNLFLATKMRNVAGLSTSDAQKSSDMFAKCRYMDELTGGRGVVFATGTPVSNSMTELYTMQRYLQYDALKRNHMTHFDCWASTFGETTTAIELAPEGTGYRARTRFAKFFNLPELMTLFKEVADIKTADQLHLPTPEAHYETVVVKPTEHQKAMVQALSERAAAVHSGNVDPSVDNMLKITSDGRKLGLDQRLINPLLPDDPASKVNACVNNIHRIWQDGQAERLTQLVFCDISTPKGTKGLDAAEFNVYDDIRGKLIAMGVPKEEIAFIHTADTEVKKKELFAKVRSGQVRVLMGSTAKMGAGTNVQDRLVASHDLDCPWRPGDLEQRAGRIVRQGNQNKDVHIYRYVTESTFDAYLWQTVENKQRFISQIMTSKSPVRSCEDVDETALSYAEIKALCAGDVRIKEKMDLDVDVARLKLMKADHQSKQYRLEDQLLRYFPQEIEKYNGFISGFRQDIQTLAAHPLPEKDFIGMELRGKFFTDREKAGEAILSACKDAVADKTMPLGSYRGFAMQLDFEPFGSQYILTLRGEMSHRVELGTDARGNLTRIENALNSIPSRLDSAHAQLENLHNQMEAAKAEVAKPFPQADELKQKSARLAELDASLNMENRSSSEQEISAEHTDRPSVHNALNVPCKAGSAPHRSTYEEER